MSADGGHVGQQRCRQGPAVRRGADAPVELGGRDHRAHEDGAVTRGGGHLVEGPTRIGHEAIFEQEVLGRISGQGQLGEGDEVAPELLGLPGGVEDPFDVPGEVADRGVDLGGGHPQRAHGPSLTAAAVGARWRGQFTHS